jgi:hypothetical protein
MGAKLEPTRQATEASVHLDALRGAAAIWVLLAHCRGQFIKSSLSSILTGDLEGTHSPVSSTSEPIFVRHFHFDQLLLDVLRLRASP